MTRKECSLFKRVESEINSYLTAKVEVSPGVFFSQYQLINRIYKFRSRDLTGSKINSDLSYDYYFDIISPRVDSETKNLRFDSKHILVFSRNPRKDFPAVLLSNASLRSWMSENGEDEKLKMAVEEFVANGNVIFKKVDGGYELADVLNTFITNVKARSIDDTDIIERYELTASQIKQMEGWDKDAVEATIRDLGNKTFQASSMTTPIQTSGKRFEIFEFTGEVSEKEFYETQGKEGGSEDKYLLAKVIVAGLNKSGKGEKYILFSEKLTGKLSDYYISAHRGRYDNRFWRTGMYELLFDHQVRANEIGNQLARGLEWASKVVFRSKDSKILQNIRADLDNGDIITTDDLAQVDVRMNNLDQLIADWNRLMNDADRLSNSFEVVRGESMPSGTPFRMGLLMDQNAGKLFVLLRQKLTLPFKRVFREWVLPELLKDMKGEEVFQFVGEEEILDQLRGVLVDSWYMNNLVKIGPHSKEEAEKIKKAYLDEIKEREPVIKNTEEIWEGVKPRLFVTITGENSDLADNVQDLLTMVQLEQDPERIAWILDTLYRIRGIPIPPKPEQPPEAQMAQVMGAGMEANPEAQMPVGNEPQPVQ